MSCQIEGGVGPWATAISWRPPWGHGGSVILRRLHEVAKVVAILRRLSHSRGGCCDPVATFVGLQGHRDAATTPRDRSATSTRSRRPPRSYGNLCRVTGVLRYRSDSLGSSHYFCRVTEVTVISQRPPLSRRGVVILQVFF